MKLLGLKPVIRRKRYTYKSHKLTHVAENILNRAFQKDYQAMEVLLTDLTEFKYGQSSKAYLSAILDYSANKIIAFKLSKHNNNALVYDTVHQIKDNVLSTRTLLHSDRNFQYISHGFSNFVKKYQIIPSMSHVGKCIDNGPMENFWELSKKKCID